MILFNVETMQQLSLKIHIFVAKVSLSVPENINLTICTFNFTAYPTTVPIVGHRPHQPKPHFSWAQIPAILLRYYFLYWDI